MAKGHGAVDRNCPKFTREKDKLLECIPENKYIFFPTNKPQTWRLLNKSRPEVNQQHQNPQQRMEQEPTDTEIRHHQCFIEDWQTIQHQCGRPCAPLELQQGTSSNYCMGANIGTADNA